MKKCFCSFIFAWAIPQSIMIAMMIFADEISEIYLAVSDFSSFLGFAYTCSVFVALFALYCVATYAFCKVNKGRDVQLYSGVLTLLWIIGYVLQFVVVVGILFVDESKKFDYAMWCIVYGSVMILPLLAKSAYHFARAKKT